MNYHRCAAQALMVKGDIDARANAVGNATGERILSVVLLAVVMLWDYCTFKETSSRDSKLRSVLSIVGLIIVLLSVACTAPAVAGVVGNNIGAWGFSYGAFLFAFSRFWNSGSADIEDGTIRIPIVNAAMGIAFLAYGLTSVADGFNPGSAVYLTVFADVMYSLGSILLSYRFVTF